MANRHLARSLAMQALYEWDFYGKEEAHLDEYVEYVVREFGPGIENATFVHDLAKGVLGKLKELDAIIERAAPEWPIEQIAMVDRNVLRVGIWELLFGDRTAVPPKVAINEAIELAKSFGGDTSGKFVNGVLGTIYREIGEPMKEHVKGSDDADAPRETLVGGVLTRQEEHRVLVAWLKDKFGYWTFPKGHLANEEEDPRLAVTREVAKEVGLDASAFKAGAQAGEVSYLGKRTSIGKAHRTILYFLVATDAKDFAPPPESEISEIRWIPLDAPLPEEHYKDLDAILENAREILRVK